MAHEKIYPSDMLYVIQRADYIFGVADTLEEAQGLCNLYGRVTWSEKPIKAIERFLALGDKATAQRLHFRWTGESEDGFEFAITASHLNTYTPGTLDADGESMTRYSLPNSLYEGA